VSQRIESEIKLRVDSAEAVRGLLSGIGAALVRPRYFEDNQLFDDAASSLASGGSILRLRRTPEGGVLTYKAPQAGPEGIKSRHEIELAVPDPSALEAILLTLGYRKAFRYQKYRETFGWDGVEIVVDETPIGTFMEIEGDVENIHAAAEALGFARSDYIAESYVGLFSNSGGQGDMVF